MSQNKKPCVAVSYSWKEETNKGVVDAFCKQLTESGVVVVRDVDSVSFGDSLSSFMQQLGASNFLCVFLSDDYLRSENCMYELLIAWQRSKDNADEFRKRIRVWDMDDLKLNESKKRALYVDYWRKEKRKFERDIEKIRYKNLSARSLAQFKRVCDFQNIVDDILAFFGDCLSPQTSQEYLNWIIGECSPNRAIATSDNRNAIWNKAIVAYREAIVHRWNDAWQNTYTGEKDWQPSFPQGTTYIDNQKFEELQERADENYLACLHPRAFVVGRDTENEALRDIGVWIERLGGINWLFKSLAEAKDKPCRIFVVAGGGVGKTKALERLEMLIQDSAQTNNSLCLAICVPISILAECNEDILDVLAEQMLQVNDFVQCFDSALFKDEKERDVYILQETKSQLEEMRKNGSLVLLLDGLDHLSSGKRLPRFFPDLTNGSWKKCSVVLSGRPYAVQHRFVDRSNSKDPADPRLETRNWTFFRPCEFDVDQQDVYLGMMDDGTRRRSLINEEAQSILTVPRVLQYVRTLVEKDLERIKTPSDVYYYAVRALIEWTMKKAELTRYMDPSINIVLSEVQKSPPPTKVSSEQVEYVMAMLSAAAFCMTKMSVDSSPNFQEAKVDAEFVKEVMTRAKPSQVSDRVFESHFKIGLAAFNSIVANGILDAANRGTELSGLAWSNKSIQCFFASLWLTKYASLKSNATSDTTQFKEWIWFHESDTDPNGKSDFYELNRFLAEMDPAYMTRESWLHSIANWFQPGSSLRSAEMMFRSWPTLLKLAGEPRRKQNWWNRSYHDMVHLRQSNDDDSIGVTGESGKVARSILKVFRSELQSILDDPADKCRTKIAKEFVSVANWKWIPNGNYTMGFPIEKQGFPAKTNAFWEARLQQVIDESRLSNAFPEKVANRIASECNPEMWFTGAQGIRLRKADIDWLTSVFLPLAQHAHQKPNDTTDLITVRKDCKTRIEKNWRRKDENSHENPQVVEAFEMHRLPILHEWFYLFAPGQKKTVHEYLEKAGINTNVVVGKPEDDHPVIYVSWFDAWAFCQWANWMENGVHYGCRLPHEVEWEYAARQSKKGQTVPCGQLYWWGNQFYTDEESPDPERKSTPNAHAWGNPGDTRAPAGAHVQPNGFGLHDMLGNVWEWCANVYDDKSQKMDDGVKVIEYSRHFPHDTTRIPAICTRAMRGGLWYYLDLLSRCSHRFRLETGDRDYKMGFRVVREVIDVSAKPR